MKNNEYSKIGIRPVIGGRRKGIRESLEEVTRTFPQEVFDKIDKRTDKTWPSTFFVQRLTGEGYFKGVYSVMNYWGANHGAISYGHIGSDLILLASNAFNPCVYA